MVTTANSFPTRSMRLILLLEHAWWVFVLLTSSFSWIFFILILSHFMVKLAIFSSMVVRFASLVFYSHRVCNGCHQPFCCSSFTAYHFVYFFLSNSLLFLWCSLMSSFCGHSFICNSLMLFMVAPEKPPMVTLSSTILCLWQEIGCPSVYHGSRVLSDDGYYFYGSLTWYCLATWMSLSLFSHCIVIKNYLN